MVQGFASLDRFVSLDGDDDEFFRGIGRLLWFVLPDWLDIPVSRRINVLTAAFEQVQVLRSHYQAPGARFWTCATPESDRFCPVVHLVSVARQHNASGSLAGKRTCRCRRDGKS